MIMGDFIQRGIAPVQHRQRPLWELNQVCGSVPRKKYHMTVAHLTTCMTFFQPGTNYVMKEGIAPLFDDPLADEVRLSMPLCNEYGVAGISTVVPSPMPRAGRVQPERATSYGDSSPEDPWPSDDDEEDIPPAASAAGVTSPLVAAGDLPGTRAASHRAAAMIPASPDSEQMSESVPPPLADADDGASSTSWSGVFGDLTDQRWFFSGAKRPRR